MKWTQKTVESKAVSMEKIASEDVLIEILVLLPPKSIFRFMSVSLRWKNIITHPFFVQRYSAAAAASGRTGGGRLLAFFQTATRDYIVPYNHGNIPDRSIIDLYIPTKFGCFIGSSNGLILCCRDTYKIVNPITGKHVQLPPPPRRNYSTSTGLMCEENTTDLVPVYTVVRAGTRRNTNILYVDTYSSRTGEWSDQRALVANDKFALRSRPPVVANGVFHWYIDKRFMKGVAVYDPNDGESHLQLIRLPYIRTNGSYRITRTADDLLMFGHVGDESIQLFVLPKGEDVRYRRKTTIEALEWVRIYNISLDSLREDTKILSARKKIVLESIISSSNSEIVAVLRQKRELFLCNIESKSVERVRYHGRYSQECNIYLSPYIESSFLSSYAI